MAYDKYQRKILESYGGPGNTVKFKLIGLYPQVREFATAYSVRHNRPAGGNSPEGMKEGSLFEAMPTSNNRVLRIVMVSPSDVEEERGRLREVAHELNSLFAQSSVQVTLQVSGWEEVPPGFRPGGAQTQIDSYLPFQDCDYLIGIFWRRLGTRGGDGETGSEHEIKLARESWKTNGRPEIMLYFSQQPYTPQTPEEARQWAELLAFRDKIRATGLVSEFSDANEFERLVRIHLLSQVLSKSGADPPRTAVTRAFSFWPTARPRNVRSEGLVELVADIEIFIGLIELRDCAKLPESFDIRIVLDVEVMNPIQDDGLTDAVLVVGKNRLKQAKRLSKNAILFEGVPQKTLLEAREPFLITNIFSTAKWPPLRYVDNFIRFGIAQVSLESGSGEDLIVHHSHAVALSQTLIGLVSDVRTTSDERLQGIDFNSLTTKARNEELTADDEFQDAVVTFHVRFREGFADAFRTRREESGRVETVRPASSGTRLRASFYHVPSNVQLYVTTRDVPFGSPSPRAVLVSDADAHGAGGGAPVPGVIPVGSGGKAAGLPIQQIPTSNGAGFAIWEWVSDDPESPLTREDVSFGIVIAAPKGEIIEHGVISVLGDLAPVFSMGVQWKGRHVPWPNSESIPCFIETGSDPRSAVYFMGSDPED